MCHLAGLADTCSGPGRSRAEALTTWMACTTFLGLGRAGRVPPHDHRHPTIDWEKSGGSSASSYDAEANPARRSLQRPVRVEALPQMPVDRSIHPPCAGLVSENAPGCALPLTAGCRWRSSQARHARQSAWMAWRAPERPRHVRCSVGPRLDRARTNSGHPDHLRLSQAKQRVGNSLLASHSLSHSLPCLVLASTGLSWVLA